MAKKRTEQSIYILFGAIFLLMIGIGFFKLKEYQLQLQQLTKQLTDAKAEALNKTYELKQSTIQLSTCINDQGMTDSRKAKQIPFTFQETGIYSPTISTLSGVKEERWFKGKTQIEYSLSIPPFLNNQLHLLLIYHEDEYPLISSFCGNSRIDQMINVCSARYADISLYPKKGTTKKGFTYRERPTDGGFETLIFLPPSETGLLRTTKISFTGKTSSPEYKNYQALINELDIKN